MENQNSIRLATLNDIPILVSHHCLMFEEIYEIINIDVVKSQYDEMDKSYTRKLQKQLQDETCKAWIFENDEKIIASGAVSLISKVPLPEDPSDVVAYIHSVYTDMAHRNNGYACKITQTIVDYCKSEGIIRVELDASEAGRPVYKRIGFEPLKEAMELWTNEL